MRAVVHVCPPTSIIIMMCHSFTKKGASSSPPLQACNRLSLVCVPLYETLGETAIEYIMQHSGCRLVATQGTRLGRVAAAVKTMQAVEAVVYWGEAEEADIKVGNDLYLAGG